ncbi:MAG: hypothetical protein U0174_07900 [Polyangiaceae bacterium]
MRSSSFIGLTVAIVWGFGCFGQTTDDSACRASVSDFSDASTCIDSTEDGLYFVPRGRATLRARTTQGRRTVTVTSFPAQKSDDAGSTSGDPVATLETSSAETDECGRVSVSFRTGGPGLATFRFDDGNVKNIEVREPDRVDVQPFFDGIAASFNAEQRRSADAPAKFFSDPMILASNGTVRAEVRFYARGERLLGNGAAVSSEGPVTLTPYTKGKRDLVDLIAGQPGDGTATVFNGAAKVQVNVRVIPLTDIKTVRWYAQSEDPNLAPTGDGKRTSMLLARAMDEGGRIVHGTPFSISRGAVALGTGDLVAYDYAVGADPLVLTATAGASKADITIHPAGTPNLQVKKADDEFAACSVHPGRRATPFLGVAALLACGALVARRRREKLVRQR